ncbi:UDP-N-acetylmuramate--L-alanine ligase [Lusitaniella coriacea LEGE 07157]|uniref:UDP-N-acetylmuramate--L-alanine ligase n=1 Tax=Lusitaniella coriacea LEGE 07157 TaxID=945747 RepID=A0A8J7E0X0_9CYAN|nr:UDP-N-acetylmuramate--L-alanine ligase [Lusitaniella coriacea]MBE9118203.1 UDP-N-acetylmuramate--L-alanine ligase [Lusitaniella coriacea LEGE 07157]
MSKTVDFRGQPFHFIGIGGIGMSALAYVLAKRKLPVSGSDLCSTHITQRLQSVGAHIFKDQEATNLDFFQSVERNVDSVAAEAVLGSSHSRRSVLAQPVPPRLPQVVCSTAISADNSEYVAARDRGCSIFHRSDILAALIKDYHSIAVAGTHGKTTTSSLIGYMLVDAGLDPTVVVGGEVNALGGNARLGESQFLVAEADESDGSLAKLAPRIGIVTNIELDHPDHYHSLDEVIATFKTFTHQCETVIGCIDCEIVRDRLQPEITYSLSPEREADYTVRNVVYGGSGTKAQVLERGTVLGEFNLRLLGEHNLANALAAIAVGRKLGLEFEAVARGLASFEGAKRRFEHRGDGGGITFIDDYAHHPSELRATLAAARLQAKDSQRVVAIFQPHRYSRTQTFLTEFATSFRDADVVVLTDIYSAGEPNVERVKGQDLAELMAQHHDCVYYEPVLETLKHFLPSVLQPGDLALFLGAGNLNQIIPHLVARYNQNDAKATHNVPG